jgi:molecular chaperone GrpE
MESTDYGDQIVCEQYQRGYRIGQRLVRPALVIVSSGPGPTTPTSSRQLDNTTRNTSGDAVVVVEDSVALNPEP